MASTADSDFETTINACMQFVSFAHIKGTDFAGTVNFNVIDPNSPTKKLIKKWIQVTPQDVVVLDAAPSQPTTGTNCSVTVQKDVLLALIGGMLDPMVAFMCGQIIIDNPMALLEFKKAFDLNGAKLAEFKSGLEQSATESNNNNNTAAGEAPHNEEIITEAAPFGHSQAASASSANNSGATANLEKASAVALPIGVRVAQGGMSLLQSARQLTAEIDKSFKKIQQDERYQTFMAKVEDTTKAIGDSQTLQNIANHPKLIAFKDAVASEMNNQRVNESLENYKAKASELSLWLTNYIVTTIQANTAAGAADPAEKKRQLEQKLAELKAINQRKEEERQQRLARASSPVPPATNTAADSTTTPTTTGTTPTQP